MVSRISFLIMLGMTLSGLGCVQSQGLPTAPPPPQPKIQPEPTITKAAPKTKRPPKPATFVAWGDLREQEAEEPGVDQARKMNLYDEARQCYQKALKVDPKNLAAYNGLARVYLKMEHCDRALEVYNQAVEKFPKEFGLWYDMGMCHCRVKQWDKAVFSFKKALEVDPENRPVTQTLGFCLARAGHIPESLEALQKIMKPAQAHFQIARMLHHVERDDLCREELHKALAIDPEFTPAHAMLASLNRVPPVSNSPRTPVVTPSQPSQPHLQIQFED